MNRLPCEIQAQIIILLAEGNSIRSTSRIVDVSPVTILKLLETVAKACDTLHESVIDLIEPEQIQCDEIWSFVYSKDKNVPEKYKGKLGYGDVWSWIAMDVKSRFIVCWFSETRDAKSADAFIKELSRKIKNRFQITTDGHKRYEKAIEKYFGAAVDYAQNLKIYKTLKKDESERKKGQHQFTPERCVASYRKPISGKPNELFISTSHVERQNHTVRTFMKRFVRASNGFSKKFDFHYYALSLQFVYYNFCRIHRTLRVTPAMEAGLADDIWTAKDIAKIAYPEKSQLSQ